jgi:ribosomal protein S18 acetylase RimI-like enzyme
MNVTKNMLLLWNNREFQSLQLQLLEWDTEMLGLKTGRLEEFSPLPVDGKEPRELYLALRGEFAALGLHYVTARVAQSHWARIQALEAADFQMVDGIIELSKTNLDSPVDVPPTGYSLRLAKSEDAAAVAQLARERISKSRFHNDPLLTKAQADRVHVEWARNCCLGKAADGVWLCLEGTRVAGFVTGKVNGTKGAIGLITVAEKDAGFGLGRLLLQQACQWLAERKCQSVTVQTQTDNYAALGLYLACGFTPLATHVTLRWAAREISDAGPSQRPGSREKIN